LTDVFEIDTLSRGDRRQRCSPLIGGNFGGVPVPDEEEAAKVALPQSPLEGGINNEG